MKLGNYHVKFQHLTADGITLVEVLDLEGNKVANAAKVKPKNASYDRKVGREAVLTKVLDTSYITKDGDGNDVECLLFSKEERTAIWNDYKNRFQPTNILEITLKEGDSIITYRVDATKSKEAPTIGISFTEFKAAGLATLQSTVHNTLLRVLGIDENTQPITQ